MSRSGAGCSAGYDDIKFASRTPELYSVAKGIFLTDAKYSASMGEGFFEEVAELLVLLAPQARAGAPGHRAGVHAADDQRPRAVNPVPGAAPVREDPPWRAARPRPRGDP